MFTACVSTYVSFAMLWASNLWLTVCVNYWLRVPIESTFFLWEIGLFSFRHIDNNRPRWLVVNGILSLIVTYKAVSNYHHVESNCHLVDSNCHLVDSSCKIWYPLMYYISIKINSLPQKCVVTCLRLMNGYSYDLWECVAETHITLTS